MPKYTTLMGASVTLVDYLAFKGLTFEPVDYRKVSFKVADAYRNQYGMYPREVMMTSLSSSGEIISTLTWMYPKETFPLIDETVRLFQESK